MNKARKIISIVAAIAFTTTAIGKDKAIAAPTCENIPSCGVAGVIIGTQIIGGGLYYIVKNATGVVHYIRAKQAHPDSHRVIEPGRHNVGDKVTLTVSRREQCEQRALRYGRETDGGEWVVDKIEVVGRPGTPGRIDPLGNIEEETIQYRCTIRKVR